LVRFEEIAIVVLLSFWWLLSLVSQIKDGPLSRFRSKDIFHLLPNWRFFAPVPARRDYHLEYRTRSPKGLVSRYQRVNLLQERIWLTTLWYPRKRLRKSFNTSIRRILRCKARFGEAAALRCVAYLHLLNYLENSVADSRESAFQFRIITSTDYAEDVKIRLALRSDWHVFPH
jgi:hypothetical protein